MVKQFKRVTSSGSYLAEIDGLRFIAIFSVVLFHLNWEIFNKNGNVYQDKKTSYPSWKYLFENGDRGVPLFFAISGFILCLPFAYHYIKGRKKIVLTEYFTRRLTRLEPPYFVTMTILFLASIFVVKNYNFVQLFPSFLSSLLYSNNIVNRTGNYPPVNIVAWSLEIEVQFYLIAPLLVHIFKLNQAIRRIIMLLVILTFPVLQQIFTIPFKSLFDYIQFFMAGLLLADLYVSRPNIHISDIFSFFAGCALLIAMYTVHIDIISPAISHLIWSELFVLLILLFFLLVLFSRCWKKILSYNFIPIIGGMCYSIYLLHLAVISMAGRFVIKHKFTPYFFVDWWIQCAILIIAILSIAALFFLLIEKPCMQKDWPKKLYAWLLLKKTNFQIRFNLTNR